MKKLYTILIICLLTYSSFCQGTSGKRNTTIEDIRKNSIYVEGLGNGLYYSINYERLFLLGEYAGFATRIGFATFPGGIIIPLEISGILGKKHCFEFGAGATFVSEDQEWCYFFRAGYRYRAGNGFLFRIAPMALIFPEPIYSTLEVFHMLGLEFSPVFRVCQCPTDYRL